MPAIANAANTYADAGSGDDSADCLTPQTACLTPEAAVAKAGPGDTTFLTGTFDNVALTLDQGKSLLPEPSAPATPLMNGRAGTTLTIAGGGAGTVSGIRLRADSTPMQVNGGVTIDDVSFDIDNAGTPDSNSSDLAIATSDAVVVTNSDFSARPGSTDAQTGISVDATSTATDISDNTLDGLAVGIETASAGATISRNQISGVHSEGGSPGIGIEAVGGDPGISTNTISAAGTGPSIGILVQDQATTGGIELTRNEVSGQDVGVRVTGATAPISLSDELIYANTTGLEAVNSGGELTVNGSTFDNTGTDIRLDGSSLTLDSSILEQPIALVSGSEACSISYSRGDPAPVDNGCSDFTSNTNPQFVDQAAHDYRLQPVSPMIDAGNPSAPPPGAVDFFGNPRAVQGLPCDPVRRDIGAAEYQPSSQPQCAQDTYANASSGSDDNDCLSTSSPCLTISAALAKSAANQTTYVADGTYTDQPTLGGGRSLRALDSTDPKPVIDGTGSPSPALTVDSSGAGTVHGLRILSGFHAVDINGTVTVDGNTFDEDSVSDKAVVQINDGASVAITDNSFVDPDANGYSIGVQDQTTATPAPVISGNSFDGVGIAVLALGGDSQISDNQISGTHPLVTASLPEGGGILIASGHPTIAHNTIGAAAIAPSYGIWVLNLGFPVGATLRRNTVSGNDVGVEVDDTDQAVTLSSDLLDHNGVGLEATDTTPPDGQGNVSATNATIYDNTSTDIRLDHANLTLDSSAIGAPIEQVGGAETCSITYSRGSAASEANGCGDFDTNAAPGFVDAGGGDYRLAFSSPLIDAGNPADPGGGALDLYGNPRAVQALPCHAVRRDIGAAEYQPGNQPQCAQDTYADPGAADDNGDCITPATACKTVAAALAKAASNQTTFLAGGTYPESLTLDGGRSLKPLDPSGPKPIVTAPPGLVAISVPSSGAGTISGLRIRSDHLSVGADGPVTVDGNVFDSPDALTQADVDVEGASGVRITNNQFNDPDASGVLLGITMLGSDSVVSGNTFANLAGGIAVFGGQPLISGNQFSGAHPIGDFGFGNLPGAGVLVINANPTVNGNTFGVPHAHPSAGVYVKQVNGGPPANAGATIDHNRISGQDAGIQVIDTDLPVTLSNDLVYDNTVGLSATDTSADSPPSSQGNVTAVNETYNNDVDVQLSYTRLTLDSSIVMSPIDMVGSNGSCLISYSRGPAGGSFNGCGNFDTNAAPQFSNSVGGDYRLQPSSSLIDAGNPAAPGTGATDFYGSARAVQGKDCSTVRRDIGAAEYLPSTPPGGCPAPPAPQPTPPATVPDQTPSRPSVSDHPSRRSADDSPTFRFSADVAGSSFRCKLDGGAYKRCSSPKTYRGVDPGKHVFRVYAVAPGGSKGRPRVFRFTVLKSN